MLATTSMVLAACGHSAPVNAPQNPPGAVPSIVSIKPTPGPAPGIQPDPQAQQILARVASVHKSVRTWTAKAMSEVMAPNGTRDWNISQMRCKEPSLEFAEVLSARDTRSVNTKLLYRGGNDVTLKTYFFGFLAITLTLPVDDSRLVDAYNHSLRDTTTRQLEAVMFNPQARVTYKGVQTVKGEAADLLDVRSPSSWQGVSREVVGVSKRLGVPIYREAYDRNDKLFFRLQLEGMRLNYPVGTDDFTL